MIKISKLVLITLYLVILAGGIVRTTGSGLGCPDWPKCFGRWIPPSSVDELPANYKDRYKIAGKAIADFDAKKTWIEYLNRLFGALVGFFILIQAFAAKKYGAKIFSFSIFNLVLVGFQGWLGSVVVSTHLKPVIISLHMIFALFLLFNTHWILALLKESLVPLKLRKPIFLFILIAVLIQILIGTQVRQFIDELIHLPSYPARSTWAESQLQNWTFWIHRSFSVVILFLTIHLYRKERLFSPTLYVLLMAITGIILYYFSFPKWAQPAHLLLSFVLACDLFKKWIAKKV